jgi:purine-binding chemotaxis protein CheW
VSAGDIGDRAEELRRAFDLAFADAPREHVAQDEALLSIRCSGLVHVVRLAEIASVLVSPSVMPVPSASPSLLGVSGVRGALVPIFDLGALLGHAPAKETPRWLLLARAELVGFAFDEFDRYILAPRSALATGSGAAGAGHAGEVVRVGDDVRPLVSLASVIAAIR